MVVIVSIAMVVMLVLVEETTPFLDISMDRPLLRLKNLSRIDTEMAGISIAINLILHGGFHAVS